MKTHRLVLSWIEDQIAGRRLVLGDRLPGERALAEQLGVSRTSVREAIRILEALGVVRAGVGSGPDAGTIIIADPAAALGSALRLHTATSHLPVHDVVQTRVLLESWAAGHADPASPSLAEAAALLERMDEAGSDIAAFLRLDALFHVALAEAAGNLVIGTIMASLREAIERYALELTINLPDWESTAARLRSEHRGIVDAVRSGRPEEASRLVREHIEGYYAEAGVPAAGTQRLSPRG